MNARTICPCWSAAASPPRDHAHFARVLATSILLVLCGSGVHADEAAPAPTGAKEPAPTNRAGEAAPNVNRAGEAAPNVTHANETAPMGRFDYTPYLVSVSLTFTPDPTVTPEYRERVRSEIADRITQTFGATWTLTSAGVREDDWLAPPSETGLSRLTYASADEHLKDVSCDKAYLLVVTPRGPDWHIAGREWDHTLQTMGTVARASIGDRRGVADAAMGILSRLFSPLLIVDDADRHSQAATVTVRAGSIPYGDAQVNSLKPGALFQPVFRFLDAKRAVKKIQPVPWSYLVLDQVEHGIGRCTVVSSFRAPLAANMRRRVEALAVLIRPEYPRTELKLLTGKAHQPLAGVFVSVTDFVPPKEQPKPAADSKTQSKKTDDAKPESDAQADSEKKTPEKNSADKKATAKKGAKQSRGKNAAGKGTADKTDSGKPAAEKKPTTPAPSRVPVERILSDRRGTVMINVDPRHPLRRIEVHSGSSILARRPFVPGIDAEVTIDLPDDTIRLGAERDIDLLRGRLIESVARRASIIGRTRAAAKKNDVATAEQFLAQIDRLPSAEYYSDELNKIQVVAVEEAHRQKDRLAERRINELCQRTGQLIEQFLPDERIQTFKEEIHDVLKESKAVAERQTIKKDELPALIQPKSNQAAAPSTAPAPAPKRSADVRGSRRGRRAPTQNDGAAAEQAPATQTPATQTPTENTPAETPAAKPRQIRGGAGL